jgi:hypothetical protein
MPSILIKGLKVCLVAMGNYHAEGPGHYWRLSPEMYIISVKLVLTEHNPDITSNAVFRCASNILGVNVKPRA